MSVFLGVNGSGKTTFFDVFGFLSDALQNNVTVAINRRGGFHELISRGCTEEDKISFEITFRDTKTNNILTYSLIIGSKNGIMIIEQELMKYHRVDYDYIWICLDFKSGEGNVFLDAEEYRINSGEYQKLSSPDILAIKGLGQFEKYEVISSFRTFLENWYVSNFKIECGRGISETGLSEHLSKTGDNLAQATKYLYDYHRETFDRVLEKLPQRIPGINKVEAKETEDGMILLRFRDENFVNPFLSKFVSDGTIKMFAYLILLYDPTPHPLLCIEEPENYLHPDLLLQLCEEIREYSERGGQVFVSTHSPDFVNGVNVEELYFLQKDKGQTSIKAANDDSDVKDLAKENQLGWLWRNHYIRGANL